MDGLNILLVILLILIVLALLIMYIDCHRIVVREYDVQSDKIHKDFTIALLTDLHGVSFGKNNIRLIKKIASCNPDIIVIAGDMYTAYKNNDTTVPKKLIKELSSQYPIYYANGNHELKTQLRPEEFGPIFADYMKTVEGCGVHVLNNKCALLEDENVTLCGLNLPFDYYKKGKHIEPSVEELNGLLGKANESTFNICIAHNPEYFKNYAEFGADLTLSGHYHGGLMRLPFIGGFISPRYTLFPKYDYGVFYENNKTMILSCGLGTHTLPIRIFNPGELSYIKCHK